MGTILKLFVIYMICIGCYNCSSPENTNDAYVINYSDLEEIGTLKFGDTSYFDTCFLIKLETSPQALISTISQLEMFDNKLYLLDRSIGKILSFDLQGNFIRSIGAKGRASNEYTAVSGFYINSWDSTIHIFDPLAMKVKKYTSSGEYLGSIKHKNQDLCFIEKATMIDSTRIFCYHGSNWNNNNMYSMINIHDYDTPLQAIKYPWRSSAFMSYSLSNQPYVVRYGEIFYLNVFSNIVYKDQNGQSEPYFVLRDKKEIDSRLLEKRLKEADGDYYKMRKNLMQEKIYNTGFTNVFENKRFMLLDFITDKSIAKAILWDKKENKTLYLKQYATYTPDLQIFTSTVGNSVICVWNRSSIEAFRQDLINGTVTGYPDSVKEAVMNFDEDEDNPMLIVFTFKNE